MPQKMGAGLSSTEGVELTVGSSEVRAIRYGTFTFNPASIATSTTSDQTVSVPGLDLAGNWAVFVTPVGAALPANVGIVGARVSADDTLQIRFIKIGSGSADPASTTYAYLALK